MTDKKSIQSDIVIAGGGLTGLTMALHVANLGLSVCIIDPKSKPKAEKLHNNGLKWTAQSQGRTTAIMQPGLKVLEIIDLAYLNQIAGRLDQMMIIENPNGAAKQTKFVANDIHPNHPFGLNIPVALLGKVLAKAMLKTKQVNWLQGSLQDVMPNDTGILCLTDAGQRISAKLCIGADGAQSFVRQKIGSKIKSLDYNQHALVCGLTHSQSHQNISVEHYYNHGPVTMVPLSDLNHSSLVWVDTPDEIEKLKQKTEKEFCKTLNEKTLGRYNQITSVTDRAAFPLSGFYTTDLIGPRMVIIGEAAHKLHPMGAQGLNLSLRDVAALTEELENALRRGNDIAGHDCLSSYQARRRIDITTRSRGVHTMHNLLVTENPVLQTIRKTGLQLVEQFTPLKRIFMKIGLGQ